MKKKWNTIMKYGLYVPPIVLTGSILYLRHADPIYLESGEHVIFLIFVSCIPVLLIYSSEVNRPDEEVAIQGKQKAMYPSVPKALLSKEPEGFILGKYKNAYVRKLLFNDGHVCIVGGSGTGKTTCYIIAEILANQKVSIFAFDLKGDISRKAVKYGAENVRIVNPHDRSTYGYDPFFLLNEHSTPQQIDEVMKTIAASLIPLPPDVKEPFWKLSSRTLLVGMMTYFYNQGHHDLISIFEKIKECPMQDIIQKVVETCKPSSNEYKYLIGFQGMAEDTFTGIAAEIDTHILVFTINEDVKYAFKHNPHKVHPGMLEEGYQIFISIKETALTAFYDVNQLIMNQTLSYLESRPEDSEPILFILDELPRLVSSGKLEKLMDAVKTLRSRKVTLVMALQSVEGLMTAYSENEVSDLLSNCSYIAVLSATTPKTQKMICDWCGKYLAKKTSWNGTGKDRRMTVSYDEMNIVEPSELLTLTNTGEAILITPYGYFRVKKAPYYQDKKLDPIAEEIKIHNDAVLYHLNKRED